MTKTKSMTETKRRFSAVLLMLVMSISMLITPAFAASTRKCYTISTGNTTVYSNTALTNRYGSIYASDEITVLEVTSRYCRVTYPISGGRTKTGYIPTSAILRGTSGSSYKSRAKITTYRRPNGSSYGYISNGDTVTVLGTYGNYTQVKYPVSGGFKYAFITTGNYNSYIKPTNNNNNNNNSRVNLSYALYKNSKAYISCGFNGYTSTRGKHEGIDIRCGNGASVYALADGVVVRVAYGYTGSKGLSTIAIYNSSYNRTIIYLHSAPYNLSAGQKIKKGQKIATESWRGCSSSSGSHTHVEVRNGRQSYAAKSVNDYNLDNPNPTSFWNSLGYNVR